MHRHDLGALFWALHDLFSESPSDEQETAVGEVHTPNQVDKWEEQVHGWVKVADDEVELARALGPEITRDFEPALEEPATVASTCARARNMNLTPQTGRPSTYQRTTSSEQPSESQSTGSRRTTAIDYICVLVP